MVISLLFIPPHLLPSTTTSVSSAAANPAVSHEEHVQDMPAGQRVSLVWRPEASDRVNVFERNMSQELTLIV